MFAVKKICWNYLLIQSNQDGGCIYCKKLVLLLGPHQSGDY
jgi:hypothetical protein